MLNQLKMNVEHLSCLISYKLINVENINYCTSEHGFKKKNNNNNCLHLEANIVKICSIICECFKMLFLSKKGDDVVYSPLLTV